MQAEDLFEKETIIYFSIRTGEIVSYRRGIVLIEEEETEEKEIIDVNQIKLEL